METKLWVRPALCAFILGYTVARTGSGQPGPQPDTNSSRVERQATAAKADALEREAPIWIERDPQGHIVKLTLGGASCNDRNLALVAQIKELRELRLPGGKPTVQGLRLLRGNTNLSCVHFACFAALPAGLLSEVADFPQITQLVLYGASAPASEYASLERMTNLADLQILYVRGFADADLARLTNAPSLKHLAVDSGPLTPGSAALLSQFRALTNAELEGRAGGISWRTNWHSGASAVRSRPERR